MSTHAAVLVPAGHSKPVGRYSPGIAVPLTASAKLVCVSGQVATDARGNVLAPGDAGTQTRLVLDRIRRVLGEAGGELSDLVTLVIYLTDVAEHFEAVSAVRNRTLGDPAPTSTLVGVSRLAEPGCLVEISGMAVVDPGGRR